MKNVKKYAAVNNFRKNIKKSYEVVENLILRTEVYTMFLEKYVLIREFTEEEKKNKNYKLAIKTLRGEKNDIDKLYELGFIKLLSDFDFFLYELVKEHLTNYPDSLSSKQLTFKEIAHFDSLEELKSSLIESESISKSYGLESCILHLEDHGIKLLTSKSDYDWLYFFNIVRNSLLHSNGKVNQKILKEIKSLKNIDSLQKHEFQINDYLFAKDGRFLFKALLRIFDVIIDNISNVDAKKQIFTQL